MEENNWKLLIKFISNRLKKPLNQPSFVFYFVFIVVGVGSFGLFYDVVNLDYGCNLFNDKVDVVLMNMTNLGLSLTSASVVELIFISKSKLIIRKDDKDPKTSVDFYSIKTDIRFLGVSILILEFLLWILVNTIFKVFIIRVIFGILSLLLSYMVWWITNVDNKTLIRKNGINTFTGAALGYLEQAGDISENSRREDLLDSDVVNNSSNSELLGDLSDFKK